MNVYFTRDSVCAGDDCDAPHARQLELPDDVTLDRLVRHLVQAADLPSITGGQATWCVASAVPLAVVAQQWDEPRFLTSMLPNWDALDVDAASRTIRFHFSYFAQQDPEVVHQVLRRLRVRA